MNLVKLTASTLAIAAVSATAAAARDNVQITGSSTVLPYATIVAEAFGENFDFPTPVVEGGGSGAGRAKMCEGVGPNTVDIANSSSRISQRDLDTCAANGVTEVMEVRIGYDGIVSWRTRTPSGRSSTRTCPRRTSSCCRPAPSTARAKSTTSA
jgi:phosphate transport system substrate-binding protein